MKTIGVIFYIVLIAFNPSQSVHVVFTYNDGGWGATLGGIYYATVNNFVNIDSQQNAVIDSMTGTHLTGKTNDNVLGFHAPNKVIYYFPRGIDKIFKNIQGIIIRNSGLKKIVQLDLQPFPNLFELWLDGNQVEVLEEGLFVFNPKLKIIQLNGSKIIKVHPDIFDNLKQLKILYFGPNSCVDSRVDSVGAVQEMIKQVKVKCPKPENATLPPTDIPECLDICSKSQSQMSAIDYEIEELKATNLKNLEKIEECPNIEAISSLIAENVKEELKNKKLIDISGRNIEVDSGRFNSDIMRIIDGKVEDMKKEILGNIFKKLDKVLKEWNNEV